MFNNVTLQQIQQYYQQVAVILLKYDKSEYKTYSLPYINVCVTTPTDILATSGCNFCGIGFGQDWIGQDFLP
jgi:hypothetical protein